MDSTDRPTVAIDIDIDSIRPPSGSGLFEAGEREPGTTSPPESSNGVCGDDHGQQAGTGSRVLRFVAERGSGSAGTAYNKRDWEVIDLKRSAGRGRVVCRANYDDAHLIVHALNAAVIS